MSPDNTPSIEHITSAKRLLNVERAYEVMDKYGLDGLVATTPVNIYYLSSHGGIMQWMGRPFSTFAFFPRNEDAPPAIILSAVMLYHLDYRPTWMPSIQAFTMPVRDESGNVQLDGDGRPVANPKTSFWPVGDGEKSYRDKLQLALFKAYEGKTSATPLAALVKAIQDGGVAKGSIGFDDPRVAPWLRDQGTPDIKDVDAINIFKEIRMVKTENEIDLLREAAQRNEVALNYAIDQIVPGFPLEGIELAHARKWGELGGRGKWMIANIDGLNSGVVSKGDFMKLDSVGVYKGYHGDVGRTVMVGDPPDSLVKRIEADTKCSRMVYEAVKPGMKFSEASKMFYDLMMQEGVPHGFGAPHNVGLEHTDQPWPTGSEPTGSFDDDFTFEDGTVYTLDMPYSEVGWGTTHVEDMIVVRGDGFEALSSMDTSLKIRPV
ncbi:MAG: M24 family metallopeptidase [Rhodospirillaceae bacterium]|nr:M24 family metallopeptidase [Rhodospirillaceae bacterium]